MTAKFIAAWPKGMEIWVLYFMAPRHLDVVKPQWALGIADEVAL